MSRKIYFLGLVILIVLSPLAFTSKTQAWSGDLPICNFGDWDWKSAYYNNPSSTPPAITDNTALVVYKIPNAGVPIISIRQSALVSSRINIDGTAQAIATARALVFPDNTGSSNAYYHATFRDDTKAFSSAGYTAGSATRISSVDCILTTKNINYTGTAPGMMYPQYKDEQPVDPNPPGEVVVNIEETLTPGQKLAVYVALPLIFIFIAYTVYRFGRPRK